MTDPMSESWNAEADRKILHRIASTAHHRAQVNQIAADPNPCPAHAFEPDPQSGAGNCVCGAAERHRRHPHWFAGRADDPNLCVCGLGPERHSTYVPESARENWMRDE